MMMTASVFWKSMVLSRSLVVTTKAPRESWCLTSWSSAFPTMAQWRSWITTVILTRSITSSLFRTCSLIDATTTPASFRRVSSQLLSTQDLDSSYMKLRRILRSSSKSQSGGWPSSRKKLWYRMKRERLTRSCWSSWWVMILNSCWRGMIMWLGSDASIGS